MIKLKNVSKYYYNKGIIASGISKINLKLNIGEFVVITGESGSGKSTLLNVISGLDSYEDGEMYIDGKETSHYTEDDFHKYRKKYISNIFQNFNLVNSYTVKQNIELVLLLNGVSNRKASKNALELIKLVNLTKHKNTMVSKLSGGQKQRVAIARALAKDTPIIIADEPTGNLDSKSAKGIFELLAKISKTKLVIVVTHNYDQVSEYATRKIRMHDGRILEDIKLRDCEDVEYVDNYEYKDISFFNKLVLGIRNAFNIIPKFLLVLAVYLFITLAVTIEYSFFRMQLYESGNLGYNSFFKDTSDKRLIIRKNDKSVISDEDYDKMSKIKHVELIEYNDLLIDSDTYITTSEDDMYSDVNVKNIKNFKGELVEGVLPQNENEAILEFDPDSVDYMGDGPFIGREVIIRSDSINTSRKCIIVGISYTKYDNNSSLAYSYNLYGSGKLIDEIRFDMYREYSNIRVLFNGAYHDINSYSYEYQIIPNDRVNDGEAYITEDWNYECKNGSCINYPIDLNVKNIYYEDNVTVKVKRVYNKNNINFLLGIKDFDEVNGAIYISNSDYNKLFDRDNYQSTIYVDDASNVDNVIDNLRVNNIDAFRVSDTIYSGEAMALLKIIRTVVTSILLIALFFISYFVIRIILKSRNIYFSIIRILGSTKRNARELLIIELFTVSNIAYLLFILVLYLQSNGIFGVGLISTIIKYLELKDYVILYLIISVMSYLISVRFSRKLFSGSAMKVIREEV